VEFLAASMTLDMGNTDKLQVFRDEAVRLGIKVAPPSINASAIDFSVRDGVIFYSLAALKNVGVGAIQHLIATREAGGRFTSLGDFARRVHGSTLNKRALESMAKAGAFDEVNANRAQVLAGVETIIATSSRTSAESDAGQNDLFGAATGTKEELWFFRCAMCGCQWNGSAMNLRRWVFISRAIRLMTT
jgi:DNA polymerase-3 subunit alpha